MDDDRIVGFFVSVVRSGDLTESEEFKMDTRSEVFRDMIWGTAGLDKLLSKLRYTDYGRDVELILFQFYLLPNEYNSEVAGRTDGYRKREKSLAASIVIMQENFFDKTPEERKAYLVNEIIGKIESLELEIKKKRLDTDMVKFATDVESALRGYVNVVNGIHSRPLKMKIDSDITNQEGDFVYDQAVIATIALGSGGDFGTELERKQIVALEEEIEKVLPENAGVDGHEFGDGEAVVYIYGPSADEIWGRVEPILKNSNFNRIDITLQCGLPDDPKTKEKKFTL